MQKIDTRTGAYGVVIQNGAILLVEKEKGPYLGKLDLPGGKIEAHETPEEALRREFKEEVDGIFRTCTPLDNFSVTFEYGESLFQHIGLVYTVTGFSQPKAIGWHPLQELTQEQLTPFAFAAIGRMQEPKHLAIGGHLT